MHFGIGETYCIHFAHALQWTVPNCLFGSNIGGLCCPWFFRNSEIKPLGENPKEKTPRIFDGMTSLIHRMTSLSICFFFLFRFFQLGPQRFEQKQIYTCYPSPPKKKWTNVDPEKGKIQNFKLVFQLPTIICLGLVYQHQPTSPQKVACWKGNPLISGKSRLVKYYIYI